MGVKFCPCQERKKTEYEDNIRGRNKRMRKMHLVSMWEMRNWMQNFESLKERDHLGDLDIDGRII
jgi:hypothetical protein